MNDEQADKFEQRVRFIAKHYREGAFDTAKAWERFVAGKKLPEEKSQEERLQAESLWQRSSRKTRPVGRRISEKMFPSTESAIATTEGRNSTIEGGNATIEGRNSTIEGGNATIEGRNSMTERGNAMAGGRNSTTERGNSLTEDGKLTGGFFEKERSSERYFERRSERRSDRRVFEGRVAGDPIRSAQSSDDQLLGDPYPGDRCPGSPLSGNSSSGNSSSGDSLSEEGLSGDRAAGAHFAAKDIAGETLFGDPSDLFAPSASSIPSAPLSGASSLRRFVRYGMAAAAVIGLLVGITVFYKMQKSRPDWVAVATAAGQTKEVYLPDSTVVTLAGGSEIRYDRKSYGKERRVVEMKGKLFFQVKREVACPFSVLTRYTRVTVLGTTFQVEAAESLTQVHVASGKVSFAAAGEREAEEVILTAGMAARYEAARQSITLAAGEDPNFLSWKTGELRFKNTPLEQVINDLNAYYRVNIRDRAESAGVKLTATFRERPLDEVLTVINQTLDTRLAVDSVE